MPTVVRLMAAAVSPDGKTLATGDSAGRVRVWQISKGRLRKPLALTPKPAEVQSMEGLIFSPDGTILAIQGRAGDGGVLQFRDTKSGHLRKAPDTIGNGYPSAFSPDWKTIATADDEGNIRLTAFDVQMLSPEK
jgi:WD40 repeat protein